MSITDFDHAYGVGLGVSMWAKPPEERGGDLVVVVDDDRAVRDSLRLLLMACGYRCEVHDSAEALLATGVPPDAACLVLDLRFPGAMDGVSLLEALRRSGNMLPALLVSGHGDIAQAVRAMRAGASDFVEKPYTDTAMLEAIANAVAAGQAASQRTAPEESAAARLARLTPRERDVLAALAAGASNKVIAYRLGLSTRTVEVHRARMMHRLGVRSLGEAVRLAVAGGLVA